MRTEAKTDLSAFADFPQAHWRMLWSTNPLSVNRSRNDSTRIHRGDSLSQADHLR
jgi:transposase-like protein